jgi:hypothetical protein
MSERARLHIDMQHLTWLSAAVVEPKRRPAFLIDPWRRGHSSALGFGHRSRTKPADAALR